LGRWQKEKINGKKETGTFLAAAMKGNNKLGFAASKDARTKKKYELCMNSAFYSIPYWESRRVKI
jgi:hypothetical protein